jgi:hypothetical protein
MANEVNKPAPGPTVNQTARNNLVIFVTVIFLVAIGVLQFYKEDDVDPCSQANHPGGCYNLNQHVCEKVWGQVTDECTKLITSLNLPPNRLIGPIQKKCRLAKFDRIFRYVRRRSPECDGMREDVETWLKSNPEF